jgi:hypothetical protein
VSFGRFNAGAVLISISGGSRARDGEGADLEERDEGEGKPRAGRRTSPAITSAAIVLRKPGDRSRRLG